MEDTLITFLVAKLAKEKGFKETCVYYFYQCDQDPVEEKGSVLDGKADWGELDFLDNQYWSRPTQSLLSQWLRGVHNIHLTVNRLHKDHYYIDEGTFRTIKHTGKTYEEVLDKGLQEALSNI